MFVKPTNKQLFLDYFSNHPDHCKKGIIYSQALRVIERCSTPDDTHKNLENLEEKLLERNYPPTLVKRKIELAKKKDRKSILNSRRKRKSDDRVRLIFTHNNSNPPVYQWIREAKKLLVKNDKAKQIGDNVQIGWKQPRNLQRRVCGLKQGGPKFPYSISNCKSELCCYNIIF